MTGRFILCIGLLFSVLALMGQGERVLPEKSGLLQDKRYFTVSGTVKDASSRESLIGASVYETDQYTGVTTNEHGFYSLSLKGGTVHLVISFVGYIPFEASFNLSRDTVISVSLQSNIELEEVKVRGESLANWVKNVQAGQVQFPVKVVNSLPSLLGETDVMKTLQLMPGVKAGNDGLAGLYVRGGNMDENLYLMDGVPVYNPSHLMGFFSTFSSNAVKNVDFYKGSFPARYGGRLSSVVDVRLKEGDMTAFHGNASVGLIAAKLNIEGPIEKDKTSFIFSARRTYVDLILSPIIRNMYEDKFEGGKTYTTGGYNFTDLNAKITRKFSEREQLSFSVYWGHDYARYGDHERLYPAEDTWSTVEDGRYGGRNGDTDWEWDWGNLIVLSEYGRQLNQRLYAQFSVSFNRYISNISIKNREAEYWYFEEDKLENTYLNQNENQYRSGIQDWMAKAGFTYNINPRHQFRFGAEFIHHRFMPEISKLIYFSKGFDPIDKTFEVENRIKGNEYSLYAEDEIELLKDFRVHPGIRFTMFQVDSKEYFSAEPRFSLQYAATEEFSVKASYAFMSQYIHLLAFGGISMPSDLWVPVTRKIKPMKSSQFAAGTYYRFKKGWEFALEGYYKTMNRQIEYLDGATILPEYRNWENNVAVGKGDAYGMEVQLHKQQGQTTGWINYTLSWANRWFPGKEINYGERYPAKNDSRHGVNIVLMHRFNARFDISAAWVYNSGSRATISLEKYGGAHIEGTTTYPELIQHIEYRNNYKLPAYHRLDLGFNFHRHVKRGVSTWNISIYNAYSRMNPFFVYTDIDEKEDREMVPLIKEASIFPIIPSFSYTFTF